MIAEQKFDDCENHGLQHSWKIFEIREYYHSSGFSISTSEIGHKTEVLAQEIPSPFLRKKTSHTRKCQNCKRRELFETEEVGKWVRG